ncbi:MAG: ThuA domain-containing protein [Planctomycetes bacterium]|nr:ThuA domain-containing protein [Planctomycetota bacterium]
MQAARRAALLPLALVLLSPGRSRAEESLPKVKLLVITGSHGHDWKGTVPILEELYKACGRFDVTVTLDPKKDLNPENLARFDAFLLHYKETREAPGRWPAEAENALVDAVRGGKGLVVLHYASSAFDEGKASWPEYEKLIGGGWRRSKGHGAHASMYQFRVNVKDADHPITQGLPASFLHAKDELYHKLMMLEGNRVLLEGLDDHEKGTGKKEPLVWILSYGKGRVFHNALGHDAGAMKGGGFQLLMQRGAEWAATGKVTVPVPASLDSAPVK